MSGTESNSKTTFVQIASLVLIVLLAIGVRYWFSAGKPLWIDDYHSIAFSTGHGWAFDHLPRSAIIPVPPDLVTLEGAKPVWSIWTSLDTEPNPPLFFVLLRLWRELGFDSPAGMRWLTILMGSLATLLVFDAARHMSQNARLGLWAALICALSNTAIATSIDLRAYSLMSLLVAALLAVVARVQSKGFSKRLAIGLCLLPCLLMLSHYYALPLCVACGLYCLLQLRGKTRRHAITCFVVSGVIWSIVWLPVMATQTLGVSRHWYMIDYTTPNHTLAVLRWASQVPMRLLSEMTPGSATIASAFGIGFVVVGLIRARKLPQILLPLLCVTLPVVMVLTRDLLDHASQIYLLRFTAATIPALAVALVLLVPGRWAHWFCGSIAVYCCLGLTNQSFTNPKENYAKMGDFFARHLSEADLVIYYQPTAKDDINMNFYVMSFHTNATGQSILSKPMMIIDSPPTQADVDLISRYRRVLMVRGWNNEISESAIMPDYDDMGSEYEFYVGAVRRFERRVPTP